jgi:hypothetical protein
MLFMRPGTSASISHNRLSARVPAHLPKVYEGS